MIIKIRNSMNKLNGTLALGELINQKRENIQNAAQNQSVKKCERKIMQYGQIKKETSFQEEKIMKMLEGQNSNIGVKNIPELMKDSNSQIQKSQ